MSHHIYTTDAYVLDSNPSGEADEFITLFTRDLGVVRATARGVRLEKSKLRYSLQKFSLSKVSLVRGKEVWRITTVEIKKNLFNDYRGDKKLIFAVANCFSLIKRMIAGEEKNEELFSLVSEAFDFLSSKKKKIRADLFEISLVLKILNNLGYASSNEKISPFIKDPWSEEMLSRLSSERSVVVREINTSLKESQL